MVEYFGDEADLAKDDNVAMQVAVIGFSRGAAQARDFANRLMVGVADSKKDKEGNYWYGYKDDNQKDKCQKVNFRFIGLWDTVLSTNASGYRYKLGIPDEFSYVAQAVALNEYRGRISAAGRPDPANLDNIGAFPLESIMGSAVPVGQTRIERGFVGSHADIGGSFKDNELSKVALAWMLQQATLAKVELKDQDISVVANPVLHDKSDGIQTGAPGSTTDDRQVSYSNGTTVRQRAMAGTGLTYAEIVKESFITYTPRADLPTNVHSKIMGNETGTVNMDRYRAWLLLNGYDLGKLKIN